MRDNTLSIALYDVAHTESIFQRCIIFIHGTSINGFPDIKS